MSGAKRIVRGERLERLSADGVSVHANSRRHLVGQLGADARDRREHRELGDAAMRFGRFVGHDGNPRRRGIERPRCIPVLSERRRTDHEDDVVRLQHRAQTRSIRGQVSRELGMVVRESGTRAERLLPHRRAELLGDAHERFPRPGVVGAQPATMVGRSAEARRSTSTSIAAGSAAAARTTEPGAAALSGSPAGAAQSSIGAMTIAGPLPVSASWYARLIDPGRSWARTGWSTQTGYSPASDWSRPARNGSCAR